MFITSSNNAIIIHIPSSVTITDYYWWSRPSLMCAGGLLHPVLQKGVLRLDFGGDRHVNGPSIVTTIIMYMYYKSIEICFIIPAILVALPL